LLVAHAMATGAREEPLSKTAARLGVDRSTLSAALRRSIDEGSRRDFVEHETDSLTEALVRILATAEKHSSPT
jgi:DNA-binding MarR family transcriptional regulator